MQNKMFSKTTSLLLIATMTLAFAGTVSAVDVNEIGANGLPEFLSDDLGNDTLELITFFLFSLVYFLHGMTGVISSTRVHGSLDLSLYLTSWPPPQRTQTCSSQ